MKNDPRVEWSNVLEEVMAPIRAFARGRIEAGDVALAGEALTLNALIVKHQVDGSRRLVAIEKIGAAQVDIGVRASPTLPGIEPPAKKPRKSREQAAVAPTEPAPPSTNGASDAP